MLKIEVGCSAPVFFPLRALATVHTDHFDVGRRVLDLVHGLKTSGSTILMATHEMLFAREVADRVVFMQGGMIIEQGTPGQVFDAPQHPETFRFLERARRGGALA